MITNGAIIIKQKEIKISELVDIIGIVISCLTPLIKFLTYQVINLNDLENK